MIVANDDKMQRRKRERDRQRDIWENTVVTIRWVAL